MNDVSRQVFFSYAWGGESERIVDALDAELQKQGIVAVRDKRDLGYKGLIREFMQRIGQGHAVVVVVSDDYLKSRYCMYELVEILENKHLKDRIFPVVLPDAKVQDPGDSTDYVRYWQDKQDALDQNVKSLRSQANLQSQHTALNDYNRFRERVSNITALLSDMNTLNPDIHQQTGFSALIADLKARLSADGLAVGQAAAPLAGQAAALAQAPAPSGAPAAPRTGWMRPRNIGVGIAALALAVALAALLGNPTAERSDTPAPAQPQMAKRSAPADPAPPPSPATEPPGAQARQGAGPAPPDATAGEPGSGDYTLQTKFLEGQNKCLDGNGPAPGAALGGAPYLDDCSGAPRQRWTVVPAHKGYFRLKTVHPDDKGLCLEGGDGDANSIPVAQAPCKNVTGQLWKAVPDGTGYYWLKTKFLEDKDLCLEGGFGKARRSPAVQHPCKSQTGQKWKFSP